MKRKRRIVSKELVVHFAVVQKFSTHSHSGRTEMAGVHLKVMEVVVVYLYTFLVSVLVTAYRNRPSRRQPPPPQKSLAVDGSATALSSVFSVRASDRDGAIIDRKFSSE